MATAQLLRYRRLTFPCGACTTFSTWTPHLREAASNAPLEVSARVFPTERPSFASLVMAIPHELEAERDERPLRAADL